MAVPIRTAAIRAGTVPRSADPAPCREVPRRTKAADTGRTEERVFARDGLWYLRERHSEPAGPFASRTEAESALQARMECWLHPWRAVLHRLGPDRGGSGLR